MTTPAIAVSDLVKTYGRTEALSGVTFDVAHGAIYGLIGVNGAGKTTTLSILAGLLSPTSGRVSILGRPVVAGASDLAHSVGFFSPQFSLFDYLRAREVLVLAGALHGLGSREAESRAADLLDFFDLSAPADHYLYEYSRGMRQKIGLAAALIHRPDVLLLDEPFESLDTVSVFRLVATLRAIAAGGRTVLLTSHDLNLVERVCDRVAILHGGRIERQIELAAVARSEGEAPRSELESALWQISGDPSSGLLPWI